MTRQSSLFPADCVIIFIFFLNYGKTIIIINESLADFSKGQQKTTTRGPTVELL